MSFDDIVNLDIALEISQSDHRRVTAHVDREAGALEFVKVLDYGASRFVVEALGRNIVSDTAHDH